jgi:hypothetical protein
LPVGTNKIKFNSVSAFGNSLYLDNVKIGVPYNNDVGVNSISDPKWGFTPGMKTPKAYVRNYGATTQSFSVTMTINPVDTQIPKCHNLARPQSFEFTALTLQQQSLYNQSLFFIRY